MPITLAVENFVARAVNEEGRLPHAAPETPGWPVPGAPSRGATALFQVPRVNHRMRRRASYSRSEPVAGIITNSQLFDRLTVAPAGCRVLNGCRTRRRTTTEPPWQPASL